MLKIKHHCPEEMGLTGKDLLKVMQNKSTPVLDLLVRESIQNSLDAQDRQNHSTYVNVEYIVGDFDSQEFCDHLEDINSITANQTEEGKFRFLAFKDSNTIGLTGPLSGEDVRNHEYGNLQKLIYQLFKNQTEAGAGGSCGVGKTTYYGVGVGIVIFYSRIRKDELRYESRLVVCLVEDPQKPDKILQQTNDNPTGIAWWGDITEKGYSKPIANHEEIKNIVEGVFGIEIYGYNETGTTVIIPYIDEQALLESNQTRYIADADESPSVTDNPQALDLPWCHDLSEYLKIAVQRWYAPRLDNPNYYNYWKSMYLRCTVNGEELKSCNFETSFKIIQDLYNACIEDTSSETITSISTETIKLRRKLDDTNSGTLAYVYVSRKEIGLKPWDQLTPSVYYNCKSEKWIDNSPIVAYLRKPGMIVSYEDDSWTRGLSSPDNNYFLLALFVINSHNTVRCDNRENDTDYSLEAYVRECEKSDHMVWEDIRFHNIGKPSIIEKMQKGVLKSLYAFINTLDRKEEDTQIDYNPASTLLGDLFMPPEGFGTQPSSGGRSGCGTNTQKGKTKKFRYTFEQMFEGEEMALALEITTVKNAESSGFDFKLLTDSSGSPISSATWEEETGLKIPLSLSRVEVVSSPCGVTPSVDYLKTGKFDSCYGVHLDYPTCKGTFKLNVYLQLGRKDVKPVFHIE